MAQLRADTDQLTCEAIGCCLDLIAEGAEPWPTLWYLGGKRDRELVSESYEDDAPHAAIEAARAAVHELPASCDCYAIVYDGFIQETELDEAVPAVIAEFGQRDMDCGYTACVPYWFEDGELYAGEATPGGETPLYF